MSTSTTVAAVQDAFITEAKAEVDAAVSVWHTYPGPQATERMVFLTDVVWPDTNDAAIKSGRRRRIETYDASFEIWELRPGAPNGGKDARDNALAVWADVETGVVKSGSTVLDVAGVHLAEVKIDRMDLVQIQDHNVWGVFIEGRLHVEAHLT